MTSTRQLGINYQNWIESWLLEKFPGAAVHNLKPFATKITCFACKGNGCGKCKGKGDIFISQRQDLFGCVDIVAVLPKDCGRPLFIQATLHTGLGKKLKDLSAVPWDFLHVHVQIWHKRSDGVTIIHKVYNHEGVLAYRKIGEIFRRKYTKTNDQAK